MQVCCKRYEKLCILFPFAVGFVRNVTYSLFIWVRLPKISMGRRWILLFDKFLRVYIEIKVSEITTKELKSYFKNGLRVRPLGLLVWAKQEPNEPTSCTPQRVFRFKLGEWRYPDTPDPTTTMARNNQYVADSPSEKKTPCSKLIDVSFETIINVGPPYAFWDLKPSSTTHWINSSADQLSILYL